MRHVTVPLQLKDLILRGAKALIPELSQCLWSWFAYRAALLVFVFFVCVLILYVVMFSRRFLQWAGSKYP